MSDLKITQAIGGRVMRLINKDKLIEESETGSWGRRKESKADE